jgi:hypothetical protein
MMERFTRIFWAAKYQPSDAVQQTMSLILLNLHILLSNNSKYLPPYLSNRTLDSLKFDRYNRLNS